MSDRSMSGGASGAESKPKAIYLESVSWNAHTIVR